MTSHVNKLDEAYRMSEGHETMGKEHRRKSAPRGAGTPLRGASPTERTPTDMASLPYPPDTASTCTDPHVDGCPECVVNTEAPIVLERLNPGCSAAYHCTDCGHSWETAWGCK